MKDILLISPFIPDEAGFGAQKRAAFHLKSLAEIYNVHLLVFIFTYKKDTGSLPHELKKYCASWQISKETRRERIVFSKLPPFTIISELILPDHECFIPNNNILIGAVKKLVINNFDAVFCFRIRSATILDRLVQISELKIERKVVDFDDVESIVFERSKKFLRKSIGLEATLVEKIRNWRLRKIENNLLHSFHDVLVCSDMDQQTLVDRSPKAKIHVIPNSVPLEDMSDKKREGGKVNLLFVGSMSYDPNEEGILWFCNEILPLIRERTKVFLSLYIVGFNPPQTVLDLGNIQGVTVTGGVDSVAPYYQQSDIVIAPIRYGGGTRIKILEAMGYQRPVVSTTIGAEGIDVENDKDIMIADSPNDFANACIKLIENDKLRKDIATAARKCIEVKYSDRVIGKKLQKILISS